MVGGSLCEPLCVRREVEFIRCLGHGVKAHVLLAQWAANYVVLKTAKPVARNHRAEAHLDRPDKFSRIISKQQFLHEVLCHTIRCVCRSHLSLSYRLTRHCS